MSLTVAILTTDKREDGRDYAHPTPSFGAAPEALLEGFSLLPDLKIHVISCLQQPVKSPDRLSTNIWYHALHVPKFGWMRTFYQGCIRAVRRKLWEIRPAIVHGQGTERDCSLTAVFSGFPNVITIHGNMAALAGLSRAPLGSFHWLTARLETLALRRTKGVFCNSAHTESLVRPRTRRTWRVPNPVNSRFFEPATVNRHDRLPRLLCVGRVDANKRQVQILHVAKQLYERGHAFRLDFLGVVAADPICSQAFREALREAEHFGYARFCGFKQPVELIQEMDTAGALVHFPIEEAFGLVVAEALARNLKVFTVRKGGMEDIANGVEGAELIADNDWAALTEAISRWLQSGCPRPTTAMSVMRERYHPTVVARRHLEIYQEVSNALPSAQIHGASS